MSDADTSQTTTEQPGTTGAATTTEQPPGSATTTEQPGEAGNPQQTKETAPPNEEGEQPRDNQGRFSPKPGVQDRIGELTRRRHEAEREAAYWRDVAQGKAQPPGTQPASEKPTPDKYDNYADFVEALTDWKATEKVNKALADRGVQDAQRAVTQTFQSRVAEFIKTTPDYVDLVGNSDVPVAGHVAEHIQESEHGPALAYHLAKNPAEAARLNAMSPTAAAREIGRIEATLAKPGSAGTAPPARKLTETPPPAGTSSSQGRTVTPDISKMTAKEYEAHRRSQGARWAR